MKVIQLTASNFKALKAVDITPTDDVTLITGANGAGKSSVLDSIWAALGGKDVIPSKPIRNGEKKAKVTLDLGDYVVERRWSEKGTILEVKSQDGAKYSSPQTLLDDMVGRLSFDPLAFIKEDRRQQAKTLRNLVGLDTTLLDSERAELYEQRTDINRQGKNVVTQAQAIEVSPDAPEEAIILSALTKEYQDAVAAERDYVQLSSDIDAENHTLDLLIERQSELEKALHETKNTIAESRQKLLDQETAFSNTTKPNTADIMAKMDDAERLNALHKDRKEKEELERKADALRMQSAELSDQIKACDEKKEEMLAAAKFPVDGLSIDGDTVTYNGIPLDQASTSEQIRVSVAMAMALNPKVRVIRIMDGSLLDSAAKKTVTDMARENDFQVWMECVDESGEVGVVIEDGLVKEAAIEA